MSEKGFNGPRIPLFKGSLSEGELVDMLGKCAVELGMALFRFPVLEPVVSIVPENVDKRAQGRQEE